MPLPPLDSAAAIEAIVPGTVRPSGSSMSTRVAGGDEAPLGGVERDGHQRRGRGGGEDLAAGPGVLARLAGLGGDDHRAGEEDELAEVDGAVLVEAGGLLPALDGLGGGGGPGVVDAEVPVGGVAEGHEVLLQLLDVGALGVGSERPPGRLVTEQERHLAPVHLVEGPAPLDGGAVGGQPGQGARPAVDDRDGVAVADGAVEVLPFHQRAAGDLGRGQRSGRRRRRPWPARREGRPRPG